MEFQIAENPQNNEHPGCCIPQNNEHPTVYTKNHLNWEKL